MLALRGLAATAVLAPRGVGSHVLRLASSSSKPLSKILIANRGEIACRVMRTARALGVRTVAVYSDADAAAMHVRMADEAYNIGPAASEQSYLRQDKILDVAHKTGAEAIHPGYGFLSENAEFSDACKANGIIFIGPPASAIRDMGSKSKSKEIMEASNVPIIRGYHGQNQDDALLAAEAEKIGYPVLIKAVSGGGGKGMRTVFSPSDFQEALESARRESAKSFNDDRVLVEKYIPRSRHVEVQVFADTHGNAVYLFERDCSVQRRHQKIIEEAPAPHLSWDLRRELGEAAVRAARAVGYVGAGTVEFIMDTSTKEFFFMEMNTRLQVEHPVTEMITNTDLVAWQLAIAAGERLPATQDDLMVHGHAFEARIYAENPDNNFMPGSGPLHYMRTPVESHAVRVDTGVCEGDEVSVHYDPMIAKLITHGPDRETALARLHKALGDFHIAGLHTNINFLRSLASHPEFKKGEVHTAFIDENYDELFPNLSESQRTRTVAQAGLAVFLRLQAAHAASDTCHSLWHNYSGPLSIDLELDGETHRVQIAHKKSGKLTVKVDDQEPRSCTADMDASNKLTCDIGGSVSTCTPYFWGRNIDVFSESGRFELKLAQPAFFQSQAMAAGGNSVSAPMTGKIVKVSVKPGDQVKKDQVLVVMEAMKMELALRSPATGVVEAVQCKPEDLVSEQAVLVRLEEGTE